MESFGCFSHIQLTSHIDNGNNLCILMCTYFPKSSGSDVNDISFNPNIVRFFNWEKPSGKRSIGFELKSAVCKLRKCFISSGMSGISVKRRKQNVKICYWINSKHFFNLWLLKMRIVFKVSAYELWILRSIKSKIKCTSSVSNSRIWNPFL